MSKISSLYVQSSNEQTIKARKAYHSSKSIFKNPIIQFLILGLVFVLIGVLASPKIKLIPSKYAAVAATIMIYSIVCEGFCLLLGYAGLVSLGSSCFVGIGAYCIFFIMQQWGLPYILAIILTLAVSMLLGLMIGFISLRIEGLFLGIVTLGLSEIIRNVLREIYSQGILIKNKNLKLFGIQVKTTGMYYMIALILIISLILLYNLMHSPTGRSMIAMKSSTSAAQSFGVNLLKYRVLAFVIACILAALTGLCYTSYGFSITPSNPSEEVLGIALSLNVLAAIIIGGYKSLWGTFAGTVFVFGLKSLISAVAPKAANAIASYMSIIIGAAMILIVMFFPGGFYQLFYEVKFKIKAHKAKRKEYLYGKD